MKNDDDYVISFRLVVTVRVLRGILSNAVAGGREAGG